MNLRRVHRGEIYLFTFNDMADHVPTFPLQFLINMDSGGLRGLPDSISDDFIALSYW